MAGNPATTSSSALSPEKFNFNFSPDNPSRITLTSDQVNHCTQALNILKEKLHAPNVITQEFAHLQVRTLIYYSDMIPLTLSSLCCVALRCVFLWFQANRITPSEMRRRCTVAYDDVNLRKNRYTDVLPCKFVSKGFMCCFRGLVGENKMKFVIYCFS